MHNEDASKTNAKFILGTAREEKKIRMDSPESVVRDLLRAEKDIAVETLKALRNKYEKSKSEWERLYADREREILELKKQISDANDRIKERDRKFQEERECEFERMKRSAAETEEKKVLEKRKWDAISEEIRKFKESSLYAQNKLFEEQRETDRLRKNMALIEKDFSAKTEVSEDSISRLKQQLIQKEEELLKEKARHEEHVHVLDEQLSALQKVVTTETESHARIIEKKERDTAELQKALQELMIQLNKERVSNGDLEEKMRQYEADMEGLKKQLEDFSHKSDNEKMEVLKAWQQEQVKWEAERKEISEKEAKHKKDTEEQMGKVLDSLSTLERQLREEQSIRKTVEDKLHIADAEVQELIAERGKVSSEWKEVLLNEQAAYRKKQEALLAEFEKIKAAREEDFGVLKSEITNLQAALAEERKLYMLEKDKNRQFAEKLLYLEQSRKTLLEQMETKERDWQNAISGEQDIFKRQIEELRQKYDRQMSSREDELNRLNEDLSLTNSQVSELRQKLSLEKSENNSRLDRIQELEIQVRTLTSNFNEERAEWQRKIEFVQDQWDKQKKAINAYSANIEKKYKEDVKEYEEKIENLQEDGGGSKKEHGGGQGIKNPLIKDNIKKSDKK
ncbi:MAG: hypothetical protein JW803_05175 [Endomicrobiales bacterium]|nr:hypothetical protein [Endomicrobiales bacterium]